MADKKVDEMETEVEVAEETSTSVEISDDKKSGKKAKDGAKKKGFFARIGSALKKFWKTMKSELKKVTWFSRKQTYTSTLLVLIVMVVSAIVIGGLDFGFSKGLEALARAVKLPK